MIGSHLLTEIKQKYAHLYNGKECLECNKPFAKSSVWGHLGAVHNKLDEVLIERGLRPIKVKWNCYPSLILRNLTLGPAHPHPPPGLREEGEAGAGGGDGRGGAGAPDIKPLCQL